MFLQRSVQFALTSSKKSATIMLLSIMALLFRGRGENMANRDHSLDDGIIQESFKTGTIIGGTRGVFIKHFAQTMISGIVQP